MKVKWLVLLTVLCLVGCGGGGGSSEPANQPPTADAGPDMTVNEKETVTLSGAGTDSDGTVTAYAWSQIDGPTVTLSSPNSASTTFVAPDVAQGTLTLTFRLTVTDDDGATASDDVVVTVNTTNQMPIADAGADFSVDEQVLTQLDGRQSRDPDGTIATWSWAQTAGPNVTLSGASTATPSFTSPSVSSVTTLTFELTVTDDRGASAQDTVTVTVNPVPGLNTPPVADAGVDTTVGSGTAAVPLDGSQSNDPDGTIVAYQWTQTAGPAVAINNATSVQASFDAPVVNQDTALTFQLTVTDNEGATDTASVTITVSPAVTVSGKATFDLVPANASGVGLDYGSTQQVGIPLATVEAISNKTVLASGKTDANGNYSLMVPASTDMFIRVKAEMVQTGTPAWDVRVVDNTNGQALYVLDSKVFNSGSGAVQNLHASSGWGGSGYTSPREAAPFAVLYDAYIAIQKILTADPNVVLPPLKMNWSVNNVASNGDVTQGQIGTSHYSSASQELFILGSENSDTDEYDNHVIIHEWGHYFEDVMSRSDSIGGAHGGNDRLDPRVAFGEGWGNGWSAIATDDPVYFDTMGNQQSSGFHFNVETDDGGTQPGWFSESTVQALLWDFYDDAVDGADNVSLGFAPIYQVMRGAQKDTLALTSIFSFASALKAEQSAAASAITALLNDRGVFGSDEWGTGETNDAGNTQDVLPVYTPLVVGTPTTLCSTNAFKSSNTGAYNKLSVRRFARLDVSSSGTYQISVTGPAGSDPDVYIFYKGQLVAKGDSSNAGSETVSATLSAG
ncbi:MAG: hypothetical protein D6694_00755, partial [Gammaproteobacteria bacterium]